MLATGRTSGKASVLRARSPKNYNTYSLRFLERPVLREFVDVLGDGFAFAFQVVVDSAA